MTVGFNNYIDFILYSRNIFIRFVESKSILLERKFKHPLLISYLEYTIISLSRNFIKICVVFLFLREYDDFINARNISGAVIYRVVKKYYYSEHFVFFLR